MIGMSERALPHRLMIVIGTRPEAIKLAPLALEARMRPDEFERCVVTTSQHREMLDQMLAEFEIEVDLDLDIMRPGQEMPDVATSALEGLYEAIGRIRPDCIVVQGDTTTTFVGALAAFYQRVPVAHVEAGLRTRDKHQPFPEEINRRLTSHLADFHFAPTEAARKNLLAEGVDPGRIWVTGNTAIDALFLTLERAPQSSPEPDDPGRMLLLTAHRRENHGAPMERICRAVLELLDRFGDLRVVFPVHPSPRVRNIVFPQLERHSRVELVPPMDYRDFVTAMNQSYLILTDSGGVQEEAPSLGKPVLVLREITERPEAVEAGTARLVGTDVETIVDEASRLLSDAEQYRCMSRAINPYGDGEAAPRILDVLARA
jgi:UDP-N-acetylglucosamine 2-epimerase (non-hydrolysing)